eukprot:6479299-Amphidinium_carterae.2
MASKETVIEPNSNSNDLSSSVSFVMTVVVSKSARVVVSRSAAVVARMDVIPTGVVLLASSADSLERTAPYKILAR